MEKKEIARFLSSSRWPFFAAIAGCLAIWFVAAHVPIYPDEIAYRILTSRGFADGLTVMNIYTTCTESFTARMPFSWVPAKALLFIIYGAIANPPMLRIVGFCTWLASAALALFVVLRPVASPSTPAMAYHYPALTFIFIASLGLIPLNLVMTRPEGPILLTVLAVCALLKVVNTRPAHGALDRLGVPPLFFLAITILYSLHPKGLFFAPFTLYVAVKLGRRLFGTPGVVAMGALVVLCAVESYWFWRISYSCFENPPLHDFFRSIALDPALLISQPAKFSAQVWTNVTNAGSYFSYATYHSSYPIDWLPRAAPGRTGRIPKLANVFILIVLVLLAAAVLITSIGDAVRSIARTRISANRTIALTIVFAVIAQVVINSSKPFYDAAFIWPMLALAYGLQTEPDPKSGSYKTFFGLVLVCAVLLTAVAGATAFGRQLIKERYFGPGISVVRYSNDKVVAEVTYMSRVCHIPRDRTGYRVVLDDLSYLYFSHTQEPILITWLHVSTPNMGASDRFRYLAKINSSGVVARCRFLPPEFKEKATRAQLSTSGTDRRDGEFELCCIPRQQLSTD